MGGIFLLKIPFFYHKKLNKLNKISKMLTAIKKIFIFTLKTDIITPIPMRYYF